MRVLPAGFELEDVPTGSTPASTGLGSFSSSAPAYSSRHGSTSLGTTFDPTTWRLRRSRRSRRRSSAGSTCWARALHRWNPSLTWRPLARGPGVVAGCRLWQGAQEGPELPRRLAQEAPGGGARGHGLLAVVAAVPGD